MAQQYGITQLATGVEPVVDIVFVHGLMGKSASTWTHPGTNVNWPQELLPQEIPNARILAFGYDADVAKLWTAPGQNTLHNNGQALAQWLVWCRARTQTSTRPIIFVAHSMGGLVVEQALCLALHSQDLTWKQLAFATYGITFLGTPHGGAEKASWASILTKFVNLFRSTNPRPLNALRPSSEVLANLQHDFHMMIRDLEYNYGKRIELFCFYEELPYGSLGRIVPFESAVLHGKPYSSVHAHHIDMTKFSSLEDQGFGAVSNQLWTWVQNIGPAAGRIVTEVENEDNDDGRSSGEESDE